MKFSTAMLKGFEAVNGRQVKNSFAHYGNGGKLKAVCALGAANLATSGAPFSFGTFAAERKAFDNQWGVDVTSLNDEGMPWEHIYGMAKAAGL